MSSAIRVTVEGDASGLVEALREGVTSLEEFESTSSETSDGLQKLGTSAAGTRESFLALNPAFAGNLQDLEDLQQAMGFSNNELNDQINLLRKSKVEFKGVSGEMKVAGKSASGFTTQLKQIAKGLIGVATVYAVGRTVAGFIKDSIDLARVSGKEGAALNRLEEEWTRLKSVAGTIFLKVTAEGVQSAIGFISRYADNLEFATASEQALERAGVRRVKIMETVNKGGLLEKEIETQFNAYEDLEGQLLQTTEAEQMWAAQSIADAQNVSVATEGALDAIEGILAAQQRLTAGDISRVKGQRLIDQDLADLEALEDITRANEEAARAAEQAYNDFFGAITEGISGETLSLLEGLKFEDLGGDEIINMLESIKQAFESGAITRDEAIAFFGLQFIEEEAFKVIQGIQSELEASLSIAAALDIDPAIARQMVQDFIAGIDLISEADLFAAMGLDEAGLEIPVGFQDPGELKPEIDLKLIQTAIEEADAYKLILGELDGMLIELEVRTNYTFTGTPFSPGTGPGTGPPPGTAPGTGTGTSSSSSGGGGRNTAGANFASHGADFTVPPGFPNDTFKVMVETGERVQVTPSGGRTRNKRGKDNGGGINIGTINTGQTLEELIGAL